MVPAGTVTPFEKVKGFNVVRWAISRNFQKRKRKKVTAVYICGVMNIPAPREDILEDSDKKLSNLYIWLMASFVQPNSAVTSEISSRNG